MLVPQIVTDIAKNGTRISSSVLTLQSIRSITQRSLLRHWKKIAATRPFPCLTEFEPNPRHYDPKQLICWSVEQSENSTLFRAIDHGRLIAEAFDAPFIGKTMDEVAPQAIRKVVLKSAQCCVESRCPVYSITTTLSEDRTSVDLERLLLPFGYAGRVTQILVSLLLISKAGNAVRKSAKLDLELSAKEIVFGIVTT
jgi:hypothetical protein